MTHQTIPYATPVGPGRIPNNRRGGLIVFGVISILIGSLAGCLTLATGAGFFFMGMSGAINPAMLELAIPLSIYSATTVLFVWVGIDSIRCKRWVRPVVISVGWFTVAASALSIAMMAVALNDSPGTFSPATTTTVIPGGVTTSTFGGPSTPMMAAMIATTGFFGVLVPAAFIGFYSTPAVRRTLGAYDPGQSWTERCPLPVFTACASLLIATLMTVPLAFAGSTPFFGRYLEGPASSGLTLLAAMLMAAAAVLMYRMNRAGWWIAFAVICLGFTSAIMTFCTRGLLEFYQRGHASAAEIAQAMSMPTLSGITPIVFAGIVAVISVGYLLWIYRYFHRPAPVVQSL